VPERGELRDPLPAILDRIAAHDVVFNTGHVSAPEAVRLVEHARRRGVARILVPSSHYRDDEVRELATAGAFTEFSFFFVSHATEVGLTHVDAERHTVPRVSLAEIAGLIRAAGPERSIVNSDAGVFVLPPPVEALREFLLLLKSADFTAAELRQMSGTNPGALFKVGDER
jgi:hypothetical protein